MNVQKGKSLDEIAELIAQNTMAMRGEAANEQVDNEDAPNQPDVELDDRADAADEQVDVQDERDTPDAGAAVDEENDAEAEASDAAEEQEDAALDDADGIPDDEHETFEIDEDTLLELADDMQVSVKDLKELYVNNKNNAENLTKTAEATQQALVERAKAQEDAQKAQAAAQYLFKHLIGVVEQPLVSPPDQALRTTNPEQYLAHLEAYQADQQRIIEAKGALEQAVSQHTAEQENLLNNRKRHEMQVLLQKVPALQAEETKKQASQDILDAASHYGFSPDEVNDAIDHRVYQMAYDAQQYRKLMSQGKNKTSLEEIAKNKVKAQTRTLRSKGTSAKNRLSAKAKKLKVLKSTAKKSGKVDDVAALIAERSRQG